MLLRGLLVTLSGFLFIFSPGVPMSLLQRAGWPLQRSWLYWGMGAWVIALIPALFSESLVRQVAQGGAPADGSSQPVDLPLALLGALIGGFFLWGIAYLILRWPVGKSRRGGQGRPPPPAALSFGFGVGLIAQVFTGLALVGAGFRLTFGDTSEATLAALAAAPFLTLFLNLLALVIFRPALLVASGAFGGLP